MEPKRLAADVASGAGRFSLAAELHRRCRLSRAATAIFLKLPPIVWKLPLIATATTSASWVGSGRSTDHSPLSDWALIGALPEQRHATTTTEASKIRTLGQWRTPFVDRPKRLHILLSFQLDRLEKIVVVGLARQAARYCLAIIDRVFVTLPVSGTCLATPACAARQVWPRLRRNGALYRCGNRDWPHYRHTPHAAHVQR